MLLDVIWLLPIMFSGYTLFRVAIIFIEYVLPHDFEELSAFSFHLHHVSNRQTRS
jgi:hypothetical protein